MVIIFLLDQMTIGKRHPTLGLSDFLVIFYKTSMNQCQTTTIEDMTQTVVELERQIELQISPRPKIPQSY